MNSIVGYALFEPIRSSQVLYSPRNNILLKFPEPRNIYIYHI